MWAFIVFLIERAVVASTRPGEFSFGVIGRMFLAVVFAFVIAVPLELKVFNDAVQERLAKNISESSKSINSDYGQQIAAINKDISAAKAKVDDLKRNYSDEMDGSGGSRQRGKSVIAKEKEKLYLNEEKYYDVYAKNKQKEIDALNMQRDEKTHTATKSQAQGFLGQMRVLGELSKEDNTVFWGIWLIRLFFLCIELIPILIKLGSGKKGEAYYSIVDQNSSRAVMVNDQLGEVRAEEMIKQQKAVVSKELLELQFSHEKVVMIDAQKRFDFYMDHLKKTCDRKLQAQQYVFSYVKDEDMRNHLLEEIEKIYDDFQKTLQSLVNRHQASSDFISGLN